MIKSLSVEVTIPRSKYIRTDLSVGASIDTGIVVGESREAIDRPVVALDGALATRIVGAEPGSVSWRTHRDTRNVRVSVGGVEPRLSGLRIVEQTACCGRGREQGHQRHRSYRKAQLRHHRWRICFWGCRQYRRR